MHAPAQLQTRHARHGEIGDDRIELFALERRERFDAGLRARYLEAARHERVAYGLADRDVIVDYEKFGGHVGSH
jgi:hypothetical protein